jgi:tRNA1(Val) A37 N6-methylase TrmN6
VACAAADPPGRATAALGAAGLSITWRRDVVPHPDRPPFLVLLIAEREAAAPAVQAPPLLLRNADGTRTSEHVAIREWFGIECGPY